MDQKSDLELSSADMSSILKKMKKNYVWILLMLFLLFGAYIRWYHIDFPYIGYHNMKEHETLDPVIFFIKEGKFLHKQAFAFYGLDEGLGYHEEYAQVPMTAFITLPFWYVFGKQIVIPRIIMLLFFLGSILLTYFVVERLTNNRYISLLSSFFMVIMPLGIYFGTHVQPEPGALFFMLLSLLFYAEWVKTLDNKKGFYAALSLAFSALFKITFLIVGIPMLFMFPYKRFFEGLKRSKKEYLKKIGVFALGISPFVALRALYELSIVDRSKVNLSVDLLRVFASGYWVKRIPILKSFINDNFTFWFFWIAIAGIILACMKYRTLFSRFIIGSTVAIVPYVMVASSKIAGHSYYQMPFLPLVAIASAYSFFVLGSVLKQIFRQPSVMYAPLLMLLLMIPSLQAANDRVYGTVFWGQDVIGNYIKERTQWGDRLIHYGHSQTFAVCSYAERRCGSPKNLSHFKRVEQVFNIPYVVVDTSKWNELRSKPEFSYISKKYHVELIGGLVQNNQFIPNFFVLQPGGPLNLSVMSSMQPRQARTYETKFGNVPYYLIENTVQ